MNVKKLSVLLLFLILVGAFLVRLYRFQEPIADWHSWRQADTSAVSRNFVLFGFDVLHPTFEDISNVPSGLDNPKGYRFVEFSLYNIFQAGFFKLFGYFTLRECGRLITIFSSILIIIFLYLLISKYVNKTVGLLTAFFYAFIPYNIYYGRTILPDTTMAMAILGGVYFFDKWLSEASESRKKRFFNFVLAIIFTASAFLLKPYALFFTLPMVYLAWKKFGFGFLKKWQLWIFLILSVSPFVFWRLWIRQYPEGVPASTWLFNGNGIRFRPSFFRWILYERLTKLISGYVGVLILGTGVFFARKQKNYPLFYSFLLSSLLYVVIIATGNVQHDYYQILIMPTIAIFYGLGAYLLSSWVIKKIPVGLILTILASIGLFLFGWYQVRDYFNINNPAIVIAGKAVAAMTPKNAKVIASYGGDTTFLYQTKRPGWASFEKSLPDMVSELGADYLVLVNPEAKDYNIGKTYKIVSATKDYILFDLHKKP
jgi:Dolichyl-phosphate-mannose-protein mannosyltransferase